MRAGKGEGYRRWATDFNLKAMSKNLIFLQERGLTDYDVLAAKAKEATDIFNSHSERRKVIEARLTEITELQKHIGAYGKTLDVYRQYRALSKQKRPAFYEANKSAIDAHRAAKEYFNSQGYGEDKKLPRMETLKKEWATLAAEKSTLSKSWKAEREEMTSLLMAKQYVDSILGEPRQQKKSHDRDER
jgi:hypothetical protein